MAKGIRVNKKNLGKRIHKNNRQKAKQKKKNYAAHKLELLKKADLVTEDKVVTFTSTRQKIMARKANQRRERSKSQMEVETTTKTKETTTKTKEIKATKTKVEEASDDKMMVE